MNYYLLSIPIVVPMCFLGAVGTSMLYDYIQIKYYNNNNNNNNNDDIKNDDKKEK
jgi:hypothetical protein